MEAVNDARTNRLLERRILTFGLRSQVANLEGITGLANEAALVTSGNILVA